MQLYLWTLKQFPLYVLQDFPDTQVLRKLNKESTEIEKIAQANEAAMSKKTFVDDMLQQDDVSGSSRGKNECNCC